MRLVQQAKSSGTDERAEQSVEAVVKVLGYELPPYIDESEAWQPPREYQLPRYVALRNRVVYGLVVTVKLHAEAPLSHCTTRFARGASECYHHDRCGRAPHTRAIDGCAIRATPS